MDFNCFRHRPVEFIMHPIRRYSAPVNTGSRVLGMEVQIAGIELLFHQFLSKTDKYF